eukprot:112346-Amphidinium_carterae.1
MAHVDQAVYTALVTGESTPIRPNSDCNSFHRFAMLACPTLEGGCYVSQIQKTSSETGLQKAHNQHMTMHCAEPQGQRRATLSGTATLGGSGAGARWLC